MNTFTLSTLRRIASACALVGISSTTCAALPSTAPGAADPLFNNGAFVDQPMSARTDFPMALLSSESGAVLIGYGEDAVKPTTTTFIVRYRADGAPDPAFGIGGKVQIGDGQQSKSALGGALAADGRMLVVGHSTIDPAAENYRAWIARVDAGGALDASFADKGELMAACAAGSQCSYRSVIVLADGRILAAGTQYDAQWLHGQPLLDRFLPDGTPDPEFGIGGRKLYTAAAFGGIEPYFAVQDADGRIVVSGRRPHSPQNFNDGVLMRIGADGAPDASFAGSGVLIVNLDGLSTEFRRLAIQKDGKIVAAGTSYDPKRGAAAYVGAVVRYNVDGTPDAGFGNGGSVALGNYGERAVIQDDGKLVVVGQILDAKLKDTVAMTARLLPNGTPDMTFGKDGVALPHGTAIASSVNGVTVEPDGRITLAGYSKGSYFHSFVARLIGTETTTNVVEFYNKDLNHYFITADVNEAAAIDNGAAGPGWSRTGAAWKSGGPNRVCRFYGSPEISPATGQRLGPNGHFYTISADECALVKQDLGWKFESYDFSGWPKQAGGACAAETVAVKRLYNNRFAVNDSNHRYTTSDSTYAAMLAAGWSGEGTVFCAPQ